MKKFILSLIITLVSICAYADVDTPSCTGNDGVSYVQGQAKYNHGTTWLDLYGYGQYKNAMVNVQYTRRSDGRVFSQTCEIKDGKGGVDLPMKKDDISDIKINVARLCK